MEILKALDMRLFGGGEIEIADNIPKSYTFHRLPMTAEGAVISPVVTALYQHFHGDEFDIWIGDYFGHRKGSVRTRADLETIELSIAWMNKFALSIPMKGVIEHLMNLHCSPVNRMHILKNKAEDMLMYALEAIEDDPEIKINPISKMMKQKITRAAKILDLTIVRPPTVIELAETVGCSARSLQIGFKKCFGTTVYEYSRSRKLELAKILLAETDYGLHEIAEKVGYNDGAYLGNAFKKKFRMTPEEFRKERNK